MRKKIIIDCEDEQVADLVMEMLQDSIGDDIDQQDLDDIADSREIDSPTSEITFKSEEDHHLITVKITGIEREAEEEDLPEEDDDNN